jgi:hypothetical protein
MRLLSLTLTGTVLCLGLGARGFGAEPPTTCCSRAAT